MPGSEFGWTPYADIRLTTLSARSDCLLMRFNAAKYLTLLGETPQLNYQTRKRHAQIAGRDTEWLLGQTAIY